MIENERIIAALLVNGSVMSAAAEIGCDISTIYRRMADPDFASFYKQVKADLLRATVIDLQEIRSEAVQEITEIMRDKTVHAATRLQAAQSILNADIRYNGQLSEAEAAANDAMINKLTFDDAIIKLEKIKKGENENASNTDER